MKNLTRALALLGMLLASFPAGAANISIAGGGDIGSVLPSSIVVLENTWRVETNEQISAWAWSFECSGCIILDYNVNYAFGAGPGPVLGPGNVLWQGPGTSIIQPTFSNPAAWNNDGTIAGSIGGANPTGNVSGNGLDVLIGWITIHVTSSTGSVAPFFRPNIDGIFCCGAEAQPTTFGAATWTPEPGTTALVGIGVVALGVLRRRQRAPRV